jgi:HEAT repeat protein
VSSPAPGAGTSTSADAPPLPTESDVSRKSSLVRQWALRLTSADSKVCNAAKTRLAEAGERSLPLLRAFLDSPHQGLRLEAFDVVYRIGPPAIGLLADMLRHDLASNRRQAADLLIDLAPDTESIQPALRDALKDADELVAGDAARALGALGEKAAPSVASLVEALSHNDEHVRLYAAEALGSIGPRAVAATDDLAQLLRDPVPGVRWAACEGLASIGPPAASAVPRLIRALNDEVLYVRICSAGALGSMGPKAAARRSIRCERPRKTRPCAPKWNGRSSGSRGSRPRRLLPFRRKLH